MSPPSEVWQYFVKKGSKVRCSKCHLELNYCNSTSLMQKHLKTAHQIELWSSYKKRKLGVNSNHSNPANDETAEPSSSSSQSHEVMNSSTEQAITVSKPRTHGALNTCVDKLTSFSHGGWRDAEITDALLFMIAVDKLPLSVTERKGFIVYSKALQPLYHLPCKKTLTSLMEKKYSTLQAHIKTFLASKKNLVLTTDVWTESMTTKSFIGLTVHYFNNIEMKSIIIGAKPMPQRKTIENLSTILTGICLEWGTDLDNITAVITDNGANIVGACKNVFGASKHISCLAHSLNIVVTNSLRLYMSSNDDEPLPVENEDSEDDELREDNVANSAPEFQPFRNTIRKIKKIVGFFRRSERATEELKILQIKEWKKEEAECLKLIQEVKTRWNSLYDMLQRFLHLCEFVGRVLAKVSREKSSKEKPLQMITQDEEDIAREARDLLKPAWQMTREISSEKSVTLSKCIPMVALLGKTIVYCQAVNPIIFNLKANLLEEFDKRFGKLEKCKKKAMATILDPRFKKMYFHCLMDLSNAVTAIVNEMKANIRQASSNADLQEQEAPARAGSIDTDDFWAYDDIIRRQQLPNKNQDETSEAIDIEISQYLRSPASSRSVNPFEEWISMKSQYPHLYEMAMKCLPILATSVPSERLFSTAGQVITKQRNRLSDKHLNMLLFLSSLDYETWRKK